MLEFFQIRDIRTKAIVGAKEKNGPTIFVPEGGQIENFISQYNALQNYEMGLVVELYDADLNIVQFVILYAFMGEQNMRFPPKVEYKIREEKLSNLDVIEILYQYNKNSEKKED